MSYFSEWCLFFSYATDFSKGTQSTGGLPLKPQISSTLSKTTGPVQKVPPKMQPKVVLQKMSVTEIRAVKSSRNSTLAPVSAMVPSPPPAAVSPPSAAVPPPPAAVPPPPSPQ